ncbi:TAXI family TRAP transporter solute-binding subunit [Kineosporia babensis]|uniref:TAXI family TRAP transporter solute-binding subunit n=1 Tax=Kineosporia babensis TaxID=499548 RepID=A0A9X1NH92_9ACTN|nr:TAXI family TRAP transporter solute-binding subunit [Kineosporia babensis]MCD5313905.1 TAXI family TRAP transporter solute-binding subunit [Kineosporia babensis]
MRLTRTLILVVLLVLPLGCGAAAPRASSSLEDEPGPGRIVITAGTPAGVYYAWATTLARELESAHPALNVEVLASSGSIQNLARLRAGTADLAVSANDAAEEAQSVPLRALARIYDDYYHVVVPGDSGLKSLEDLAGLEVAIGDAGSGTALIARRLLGLAGISVKEKELGIVDGLEALEADEVDAVFWSGGVTTDAVENASRRMPIRLLGLGDLPQQMRASYGAVYRPAAIPPGHYDIPEQVDTVALANLLIAREDADADLVTAVLTTIFDRREVIAAAVPAANQTDLRSAILTGSLELHPAAIAYYRREKL